MFIKPLLSPYALLRQESQAAKSPRSDVKMSTRLGADGREKTIITISAKAQGNFSESNYCRDQTIIESDNIRTYTFDTATSRLEGVRVRVRTKHGSVLVFETTKIEYNRPLNASLFHLRAPKNTVNASHLPQSAIDTSRMSPEQFARAFFVALSKYDWKRARAFGFGPWLDSTDAGKIYGGLKLISIGKPFKCGIYAGLFVPYVVRLKSGNLKKFNLAIRNDNPRRQWQVDGGI